MTETEILALATQHLGTKFNAANVIAFYKAAHTHGISAGSRLASSQYEDVRTVLATSAHKDCRGCDGTGMFYGNVSVCPCTMGTRSMTVAVEHIWKLAKVHALFVGVDQGHTDLQLALMRAMDHYRATYANIKGVRYWYHDESDCLVTTFGDEEAERVNRYDQLDELTREEFAKRLKDDLEKRVSQISAENVKPSEDDDEL